MAAKPNAIVAQSDEPTTVTNAELARPADERIDFVAMTTPNSWHFPIARDFLEAGFHVMCEKPIAMNAGEAKAMLDAAQKGACGTWSHSTIAASRR